ncbi:MAG: hypothetical protein AAFR44_10465, partial [Pseudomonadota bacterium]
MMRPRAEILADRMAVVLALGQANAAHNKAVAGAGGAEIARLATAGQPGTPGAGAGQDHGFQDHDFDAAQQRLAEADARVAELEPVAARGEAPEL